MASPFPGMDPFLEDEEWEDFHTRFNTAVSEAIAPHVEPRYIVRVEQRVYVEHSPTDHQSRRADVAIMSANPAVELPFPAGSTTATVSPVECLLPISEEIRETYLVVRERESRAVVTILETLSPANKRTGSDGRRHYLAKRNEVLRSQSHLVEIDLLRGGDRLPMYTPLPQGDYYVIVSRQELRPRANVYAWTIRDRLPRIPIPLQQGDPDVALDVQTVFDTVYDRARYGLSIIYDRPLSTDLSDRDKAWLAHVLAR